MVDLHIWVHIARWFAQCVRYVRLHALVSTRLSCALGQIVWLVARLIGRSALTLCGPALALGRYILSLSSHLIYLALLVILVSCIKSLRARYRFLPSNKEKAAQRNRKLLEKIAQTVEDSRDDFVVTKKHEDPNSAHVSFKGQLERLLEKVLDQHRRVASSCANTVTGGNIQSTYKCLSWSNTRCEFESVYWFNHTVATLWPSFMTLINRWISEAKNREKESAVAAKNTGQLGPNSVVSIARRGTLMKTQLIRERDITSPRAKLSIYLSCRRQLEQLRKHKKLVMTRGDEYLGSKVAVMVLYLAKTFVLLFKQCLVEQLRWLASLISSSSLLGDGESSARQEGGVIEIDLKEILRQQNVKLRLPARPTGSAPEFRGPPRFRRPRVPGARFKSAPTYGLPCKSLRLIGAPSGLVRLDHLRSRREKLARSFNQLVLAKRRDKTAAKTHAGDKVPRPPTIEQLQLGSAAPEITSIKFLDGEDRHLMDEILREGSHPPASNTNNMRLIIEFTYGSDKELNVQVNHVPLLGKVRLDRLAIRLRLLVSINHRDFDDKKNLSILEAIGGDHLLPLIEHVQLSLIDTPQLDWHLVRVENSAASQNRPSRSLNKRREIQMAFPKRRPNDWLRAWMTVTRRNLQPISIINHDYFKYLIHMALRWLQLWFQPFDIRIGELVYLKTLW